jgi:hypothetical protein
MHSSTVSAHATPPATAQNGSRTSRYADVAYQGLTILAMILLLGSLWLFR